MGALARGRQADSAASSADHSGFRVRSSVRVSVDARPAEAGEVAGDRDRRLAFSTSLFEASPDVVEALLGLPGDRERLGRLAFLAALKRAARAGRAAAVPDRLDEQAAGLAGAGLGDRALAGRLPRRRRASRPAWAAPLRPARRVRRRGSPARSGSFVSVALRRTRGSQRPSQNARGSRPARHGHGRGTPVEAAPGRRRAPGRDLRRCPRRRSRAATPRPGAHLSRQRNSARDDRRSRPCGAGRRPPSLCGTPTVARPKSSVTLSGRAPSADARSRARRRASRIPSGSRSPNAYTSHVAVESDATLPTRSGCSASTPRSDTQSPPSINTVARSTNTRPGSCIGRRRNRCPSARDSSFSTPSRAASSATNTEPERDTRDDWSAATRSDATRLPSFTLKVRPPCAGCRSG